MKLGVVASALSTDPHAAAARARALGFDGILFDAVTSALDVTALSQTGRREFAHMVRSQNLSLIGLSARTDSSDMDRTVDRLGKLLPAARGLSTTLACVELVSPLDQLFVNELGRLADQHGVQLALMTPLMGFASVHELLSRASCPWLGVDLDPVAVLRDSWSESDVFTKLGSMIRHVRARDALIGENARTAPAVVGRGSVKWIEFQIRLDQAGYRGWVTVDPVDLPDRVAAASVAAQVLQRAL